MKPQTKILLMLGRECLRIRKLLLDSDCWSPEWEQHRADLMSAWSIYRVACHHYRHDIPRFQVRFY